MYLLQKYFLYSFLLICGLTNRDWFLMQNILHIVILYVQEVYVFAPFSVGELYRHNPFFIDVDINGNIIQNLKFLNLTSFNAREI